MIRAAKVPDAIEIAGLMDRAWPGKADKSLLYKRACQYVSRRYKQRVDARALVLERDGAVVGFLYAEAQPAFEVATNVHRMHVHVLVGTGAVPLLRELRNLTRLTILLPSWALLGRMQSFRRLLRPLGPKLAGEIYQL